MRPASCDVGAPAVERGEHVQGDRQDLERQEDRDEVVGRRHQHHAGGRAQHQREVLGPFEVLTLQVARRQQQREQRRDEHDGLGEHRETVDRDHADLGLLAGEQRLIRAVVLHEGPLDRGEHRRGDHAADRDDQRRLVHVRAVADERSQRARSRARRRRSRSPARSRTSRSTESRCGRREPMRRSFAHLARPARAEVAGAEYKMRFRRDLETVDGEREAPVAVDEAFVGREVDRRRLVVAVRLDLGDQARRRSAGAGRARASGRSRGTATGRAAARPCRSPGTRCHAWPSSSRRARR